MRTRLFNFSYFFEAVVEYRALRAFSENPTANEGLLSRAERARVQAVCTETEGRLLKAHSLPNGLGKKRTIQKIVREFGDHGVPSSKILPQIWAIAGDAVETAAPPLDDAAAGASVGST
jgi:hypothetical protein